MCKVWSYSDTFVFDESQQGIEDYFNNNNLIYYSTIPF